MSSVCCDLECWLLASWWLGPVSPKHYFRRLILTLHMLPDLEENLLTCNVSHFEQVKDIRRGAEDLKDTDMVT